jgi:hypothetical protein
MGMQRELLFSHHCAAALEGLRDKEWDGQSKDSEAPS